MTTNTRVARADLSSPGHRRRGQLLIVVAAIGWSTAGLLQRELSVTTATQVCGRSVAALLVLSAVLAVKERGQVVSSMRSIGRVGIVLALCMAGAMGMFIFALNHSSVANVLFIQAMAPFVAVILAWFVMRERSTRRTWIATAVAITGVGLMVGGPGRGSASGLIASCVMTVLFSITIVLTRHRKDISMLPALVLGQLILFLSTVAFADFGGLRARDYMVFGLMGAFQMGMSQVCFAAGARLIPAAEVALLTLLEVVLGPLWVWLVNGEVPGTLTLIGGGIVLLAVVYQTTESVPDAGTHLADDADVTVPATTL
jgi:drug/metabolite transporter (DMT)-like permease